MLRHLVLVGLLIAGLRCAIGPANAADLSVWFGPAPDSSDYLGLFTHPNLWAKARSHVGVFAFGPAQLSGRRGKQVFAELARVNAFQELRKWGIETAIAVDAVKSWDCDAHKTPSMTIADIKSIHEHGGEVNYVAMDEPLVAGIGRNNHVCKGTMTTVADDTVALVRRVRAQVAAQHLGTVPDFVEMEPYPSIGVEQHEAWIDALIARGYRPASYDLDIEWAQVNSRPERRNRFASDLRALRVFLQTRQIPFGMILWSSRDPVPADKDYFDDALEWTRRIYGIVGRPDQVFFSSWVTRCSGRGKCKRHTNDCPDVDDAYCGEKSVPTNLPDDGANVFSHTRLILNALDVLEGK
jgi:hypothetical protein